MRYFKEITSSRKNMTLVAAILIGLGIIVGIEKHKASLLFPGPLTAMSRHGEEIQGHVSHAEFEDECSHCHGPIHCVIDTRCQDCHVEVAQQRADNTGLHGSLPGAGDCDVCHTEHKGREQAITSFAYANIDHQRLSGFNLALHTVDYEQNPMTCESCHNQDSFASATLDCVSCHAEGDHDGLAEHIEIFGPDCLACHDGEDCYTDFEHAQVYSPVGAHRDIACEECHQNQTFAGTPSDCASCHEEPQVHAGIFGVQCERCHSTVAWQPAELKLHTFLVDHGEVGGNLKCETCHEHTYTEYPCYSCHDSQEMVDLHEQGEIYAFENCIDCHPTGREGEEPQFLESGFLIDATHQE